MITISQRIKHANKHLQVAKKIGYWILLWDKEFRIIRFYGDGMLISKVVLGEGQQVQGVLDRINPIIGTAITISLDRYLERIYDYTQA